MQAIKAIYDGVNFKLKQPIPVNEEYEVVITFIEPLRKSSLDTKSKKKHSRSDFIGLFEGKIKMADDFNEPIEDMMEYME